MFVQLFTIALLICGYHSADETPVVETPLGKVSGYTATSFGGRKFLAFEGIPYAKPPLGERRFEEPEPIDPWDGILDARFVSSCIQVLPAIDGLFWGSEDCLHINVYVPREEISPDENLEVVVHIHGGAFYTGSGNAYSNPRFVTDKEVIFVTFNYRLTLFGFLSTEDDVVPGNNGLKDQVLALKWVKNNIASFGGNPDSITINGLSAGSTSVHFHYLSEQSKGLFHRGMCQSGLSLNAWAITEGALDKARMLADSVGCPTDDNRNLVDCMKGLPYQTLVEKISIFYEYKFLPVFPFGPVVEKGGSNPFIDQQPYELMVKGHIQDLPILISNVPHEGLVNVGHLSNDDFAQINDNWDELAPLLFDYNYTLPQESWLDTAKALKEHYYGDEEVTPNNYLNLVQAFTDRYFEYDDETAIKVQANVTTSPVYYYLFAYPGDNNPAQTVEHGAEIKYMYGYVNPLLQLTEDELKMKDLLWDMVVSFAKTGVPLFKDAKLQPTEPDRNVYLNIAGLEPEDIQIMISEQFSDRTFWKSLNIQENDNLIEDL